ncbi:MAG: hypothetical protein Q9169_004831 [Polycauliona sp. 2 TL-2023]
MAITRSDKRTRVSGPKSNQTQLALHKSLANAPEPLPVVSKQRKNGLIKELTALGIVPKPKKKVYDGPGERGKGTRVSLEGIECIICAEPQPQCEFPEAASLSPCNHPSRTCRTCIARHTKIQLSGDGKWHNVQCLECHSKQTKAHICKLVWKEDFKGLEAFAKSRADRMNPRYNLSHPEAKSIRTSEQAVRKLGKQCPGCTVYIEKDGGCNSMFCSLCGTYFNWGQLNHD